MAVTAKDIIEIIKKIPTDNRSVRILASLTDSAYKWGSLTPKQEILFEKVISELRDQGAL